MAVQFSEKPPIGYPSHLSPELRERIWLNVQTIFADMIRQNKKPDVARDEVIFFLRHMTLDPSKNGQQYGDAYAFGMKAWDAALSLAIQSVQYVSARNILRAE